MRMPGKRLTAIGLGCFHPFLPAVPVGDDILIPPFYPLPAFVIENRFCNQFPFAGSLIVKKWMDNHLLKPYVRSN